MIFGNPRKAAQGDMTKRRVILSQNVKARTMVLDPGRYRGVRKLTPNAIPKDGFRPLQTADLRDIERRKMNAIVAAQKKAAGEKARVAQAGPAVKAKPVPPPAKPAEKPKGRPGRPRKTPAE